MVIVAHERAIIKLNGSIERNAVPEIRDTLVNAAIRGDTSNNKGHNSKQHQQKNFRVGTRTLYIYIS